MNDKSKHFSRYLPASNKHEFLAIKTRIRVYFIFSFTYRFENIEGLFLLLPSWTPHAKWEYSYYPNPGPPNTQNFCELPKSNILSLSLRRNPHPLFISFLLVLRLFCFFLVGGNHLKPPSLSSSSRPRCLVLVQR